MRRFPPFTYLLASVLLFAAANSVVKRLAELGAEHAGELGSNPISFCNLLFAGNLVALFLFSACYRKDVGLEVWRALRLKDWVSMSVVAVLSVAVAPSLMFMALDNTSVNSVVLVSRLEPPLVLALGLLVLGERVTRIQAIGAAVCLGGVLLVLVIPLVAGTSTGSTLGLGKGELQAAGAACAFAVGTIVSKIGLKDVALGPFVVFRNVVGLLVFMAVVLQWFGVEHFSDVLSPFLWKWMLAYGAGIVFLGQLLWFMGLQQGKASEATLATSFTPIAGVLFAFLILGEHPGLEHYLGGAVIILGIGVSQWGGRRTGAPDLPAAASIGQELALEGEAGFKGV